jgi:hypothetical protein
MTIADGLACASSLPAAPVAAGILSPRISTEDGITFRVQLSGKSEGQVALIDADDVELVGQFTWRIHYRSRANRKTYARTQIWLGGRRVWIWMHRLIAGLSHESVRVVDHGDSNGLNNRRKNLRIALQKQNDRNKRVIQSVTGFKGVSRRGKRFVARITINAALQVIGTFDTAELAAAAYDKAAKRLHGRFAATNAELRQQAAA